MKPLPTSPGRRELCPKNCKYRAREVPFCGFCVAKIKSELGIDKKEDIDGTGQDGPVQVQSEDA